VAAYDASSPLVIDPVLSYSTFLGGSGVEGAGTSEIAVDGSGNAYITGDTNSIDFPTTTNSLQQAFGGGDRDAFVTKLDSTGGLVYSSYLGGSGLDYGFAIALEPGCSSNCNAYVAGATLSLNFPATGSAFQLTLNPSGVGDAFIVKLNSNGSNVLYSTYLGGNGADSAVSVAVDLLGKVYITGITTLNNFPTKNSFQAVFGGGTRDAFVAKLDPSQDGADSLVYSTYFGGGADEEGISIAVDSSGKAYVTGYPLFVAKFDPSQAGAASLIYFTSLGSGNGYGIAVEPGCAINCSAYVAGFIGSQGFVKKLNAVGSIVYSTSLGGSGDDPAYAIAVDSSGNAYAAGTAGPGFPTTPGALQSSFGGGAYDAFVTKIDPAGQNVYSTYLGGNGDDQVLGIADDSCRGVYVTGTSNSSNFPTVNAFQPYYGGGGTDGFVAKINSDEAPTVEVISGPVGPVQVNTAITVGASFTDPGVLDTHTGVWSWGDGTTSPGIVTETNGSGSVTGSHTYTAAGVYTVTLTVTGNDSCSGRSVFQFVVVYDPNAGFVTGNGWINSPVGAYAADPSLTGKANFGFVSRYRRGAIVPEGQTEFQFSVANLIFHSSTYDWLVVGGARAQYKGTGTINGLGSYNFILTAVDGQRAGGGGVDKFRIKIWSSGGVVYDNQMGAGDDTTPTTQLGGGSIVIHTN